MSVRFPDEERRAVHIELRAAGSNSAPTIRGHAAVFNSPSEMMSAKVGGKEIKFREIIKPGAFADALANSDVRALFNHVPDNILGRTSAKTLRLKEDDTGLDVEIDPPETNCGRDLQVSMKRGDIKEMSFGFTVGAGGDTWARAADGSEVFTRTIAKFDRLFDVSPVTYPAYPETDCSVRSLGAILQLEVPAVDWQSEARKRQLQIEEAYGGGELRVNMGYAGYNSLGTCKMCNLDGCLCPGCDNMRCCNMQTSENGGCCTLCLKPGCMCLGCPNTDQCKMMQMYSM